MLRYRSSNSRGIPERKARDVEGNRAENRGNMKKTFMINDEISC
jgi:hypothetical protein